MKKRNMEQIQSQSCIPLYSSLTQTDIISNRLTNGCVIRIRQNWSYTQAPPRLPQTLRSSHVDVITQAEASLNFFCLEEELCITVSTSSRQNNEVYSERGA